jgi:hypothetical protein
MATFSSFRMSPVVLCCLQSTMAGWNNGKQVDDPLPSPHVFTHLNLYLFQSPETTPYTTLSFPIPIFQDDRPQIYKSLQDTSQHPSRIDTTTTANHTTQPHHEQRLDTQNPLMDTSPALRLLPPHQDHHRFRQATLHHLPTHHHHHHQHHTTQIPTRTCITPNQQPLYSVHSFHTNKDPPSIYADASPAPPTCPPQAPYTKHPKIKLQHDPQDARGTFYGHPVCDYVNSTVASMRNEKNCSALARWHLFPITVRLILTFFSLHQPPCAGAVLCSD